MIDSAGRKVVVWSERKYEVYEFYKKATARFSNTRMDNYCTYALEELSEDFIYGIGIPSVSSFGEHVSTGACCRGQ